MDIDTEFGHLVEAWLILAIGMMAQRPRNIHPFLYTRLLYCLSDKLLKLTIVALLGLFEKAGWDLSRQGGIRDAIIKNLGLPDYIEQDVQEGLHEHGDAPIETLLDGQSALDAI